MWAGHSPLLSGQYHPIWGLVKYSVSRSKLLLCKVCYSPLPISTLLTQRGAALEQEGLEQVLFMSWDWNTCLGYTNSSQSSRLLPIFHHCVMVSLSPFRRCARFVIHNLTLSSVASAFAPVWNCNMEQDVQELTLGRAGAYIVIVARNRSESWAVSICFLHFVLGVSKCVHILCEQSLDFLQHCY